MDERQELIKKVEKYVKADMLRHAKFNLLLVLESEKREISIDKWGLIVGLLCIASGSTKFDTFGGILIMSLGAFMGIWHTWCYTTCARRIKTTRESLEFLDDLIEDNYADKTTKIGT